MDKVRKSDTEWHEQLTEEQYAVTRRKGTEPAFTGIYTDTKDPGTYRCVCCDAELFRSGDKYDSGSGWPSFTKPFEDERVNYKPDDSQTMRRTEVTCAACDAHLGHVFPDGPRDRGGHRYCINSVALKLDKQADD